MFHVLRIAMAFALTITAFGGSSSAAGDPANLCQAAKLKETGKLASCVSKSLSKSAKTGAAEDAIAIDDCRTKFFGKIDDAEMKGAGACPTDGDGAGLATDVVATFERIDDKTSGVRFVDRMDGTILDTVQEAIWQKQTAGAGCHNCVDTMRGYDDILDWLGALSDATSGLGGQRDWGLPTIEQLQSIVTCTELPCTFASPLLGPNPSPAAGGSTYLLSGTTGFSTIPCVYVLRMEDGSIQCLDKGSTEGSSRARVMNNAR